MYLMNEFGKSDKRIVVQSSNFSNRPYGRGEKSACLGQFGAHPGDGSGIVVRVENC